MSHNNKDDERERVQMYDTGPLQLQVPSRKRRAIL